MKPREKSIDAAAAFRRSMSMAALITGATALIGSWMSLTYEPNLLISCLLGFTSAWATICLQVEGLILGKVINIRTPGVVFIALSLVSPLSIPLIAGVFMGMSIYLLLLAMVVGNTEVRLAAGDRFYQFRYPFATLVPLCHLSDEPLSPVFDPIIAFYWTLGPFNIRIWRISIFDPTAIHEHIRTYGRRLNRVGKSWYETLACFRRAVGLLYLLDSLRRYEEYDLDGVALAACARLALADIPDNAKLFLREVSKTLKQDRRDKILQAFDLA